MSRTSKIVPTDIVFLSVFEFVMIFHFGRAFSRPDDKPGNLAGAMGCLPHLRFFLIQLPTRRVAVNVVSARREGENRKTARLRTPSVFCCPVTPKNSGPQGRIGN